VLGADIYEIFSPRSALAAGESACLKLPFYGEAETVNYCGMRLFSVALLPLTKRSQKAGPVRHTSTKFFVMWKSSGWIFS
jgi:hypothetical protein